MRFKLRSLWLPVVFAAAQACTNVGFVDSAKAAANDEFGLEVFTIGATSTGSFLIPATDPLGYSACMNLFGIAKANCYCENEASARQFKGSFRAWLSISGSVDAICNVQGNATTGCSINTKLGPFYSRQAGGTVVHAEDFAELSTSGFRTALDSNGFLIWTGTRLDGRASGSDCTQWTVGAAGTVTFGNSSASGAGFTNSTGAADCTGPGRLICMREQR